MCDINFFFPFKEQSCFTALLKIGVKELPILLKDEASVYFNVTTVDSMTSGVKSVQHQCSKHAYNELPISFGTFFCFLVH